MNTKTAPYGAVLTRSQKSDIVFRLIDMLERWLGESPIIKLTFFLGVLCVLVYTLNGKPTAWRAGELLMGISAIAYLFTH